MTTCNKIVTVQYTRYGSKGCRISPIKKMLAANRKGTQLGRKNSQCPSPALSCYESKYIHNQK